MSRKERDPPVVDVEEGVPDGRIIEQLHPFRLKSFDKGLR
jgi:hypothetical protein